MKRKKLLMLFTVLMGAVFAAPTALAELKLPESSYEQYVETYGLTQGRRQLLNDVLAVNQKWDVRDYGLGEQTIFCLPECYASVRRDEEGEEYVVLLTGAQDEDSEALRARIEEWGMLTQEVPRSANEMYYWMAEFKKRGTGAPWADSCYADMERGAVVVELREDSEAARAKIMASMEQKAPIVFQTNFVGVTAVPDDRPAEVDEPTWKRPAE